MKVFFTGSISSANELRPNYQAIAAYLKSKNIAVIADHILNASEDMLKKQTKEQRLRFHTQVEQWIHAADCMIAETSHPSISVGYEISLALKASKPVLILYSKGDAPSLFAYHKDEKVISEHYTLQTLPETLNHFLDFVHDKSDMRFTFFITPSLAHYLDNVSKSDKIPKSVYLRKLIEKDKKHRKM